MAERAEGIISGNMNQELENPILSDVKPLPHT
jgi:hypothetical protein